MPFFSTFKKKLPAAEAESAPRATASSGVAAAAVAPAAHVPPPQRLAAPAAGSAAPRRGLSAGVDGTAMWAALRPIIADTYRAPLQPRSKTEMLAMYTRLFNSLLEADERGWSEVLAVQAIPLEGQGLRMRNAMVLRCRVELLLRDHCDVVGKAVCAANHMQSKVRLVADAFDQFQLSTKLARCFAFGAYDQALSAHSDHTAQSSQCHCCQANSAFDRTAFFARVAAASFKQGLLLHRDIARALEAFTRKALWDQWNGESVGVDALALRLQQLARSVGAADWFNDLVVGEYEVFLRHIITKLEACSSSELCSQLAQRFRGDVIASSKWLDPLVLERMQLAAAQVVEAQFERLVAGLEGWLLASDSELLRSLYFLYALQVGKMRNVVWLESNLRTCAARHLARELTSATGCNLAEIRAPTQLQQPQQLIDAIFDWRGHYGELVASAFDGNTALAKAVRDAAKAALQGCAVVLAFLVHHAMVTKAPVESVVDLFSFTFPLVEEADVCVANILANLEARLLSPGAQLEQERAFVAAIRGVLPPGNDARKMEIMVRDLLISAELQPAVDAAVASTRGSIAVALSVLSTNCWSIGSLHRDRGVVELPREFTATMAAAERAFTQRRPRQHLEWVHSRGFVSLRSSCFSRQQYEIVAPVVVYLLLSAFDRCQSDVVSHDQLLGVLNPTQAVLSTIERLVKMKMIIAAGDGGPYTLRREYANPAKTRKINLVPRTTIAAAKTVDSGAVRADRDLLLQAIVVRVMKSKRAVSHRDLLEAVVAQLRQRFVPTVPAIKRAIATLIEKEYLKRSADDRDSYEYLA